MRKLRIGLSFPSKEGSYFFARAENPIQVASHLKIVRYVKKKLTIKLPYSKKGLWGKTLWYYRKKDYDLWSYRLNITNGEVLMYETRNGQVGRFYTIFKAKKLSHAEKNNHC